jgi:hypothetical protein
MFVRRLPIAALLGVIAVSGVWAPGCGGDCRVFLSEGLIVGCDEVPPGPDDLAFGTAAQVLVEDATTGARIWIGIDGDQDGGERYCEFVELREEGRLEWIGGTVVVSTDRPLGFFFDPSDIIAAEVTVSEIQVTLAQISLDPDFYAPDGLGAFEQWVVPAAVLAVEIAGPTPIDCANLQGSDE